MQGFGLILSEAFVKIFGPSKFTLRFADFAGGLLYVAAIKCVKGDKARHIDAR